MLSTSLVYRKFSKILSILLITSLLITLWIDAFCIFQDQDYHSDRENEVHNMDKIYSCAFLNVSATISFDGSECLFKQRSWGSFLPSEIELEVNGLFQKCYVLDGNIWYDEIIDAPLS